VLREKEELDDIEWLGRPEPKDRDRDQMDASVAAGLEAEGGRKVLHLPSGWH